MAQLGLNPNGGHRKSATVVGEVIGKYHPHGDQSIYDAMVRLAQDFATRTPLVDGQGNFGNIDGDAPAAFRYTEAKLTPAAMLLLEGLDEDAVDFRDTYDERNKEPVVLAAGFPNLLVNGSSGIAAVWPPRSRRTTFRMHRCRHPPARPSRGNRHIDEDWTGPTSPPAALSWNRKKACAVYATAVAACACAPSGPRKTLAAACGA
jgi:hypothetical protein